MKTTILMHCALWALCSGCAAHDSADGNSRLSSAEERGETHSKSDASTEEGSVIENETLQHLKLRFTDSSVPPQYHRSYTIVVEAGSVQTTVDVYDDIIASDEHEIDDAKWAELADDAQRLPSTLPEDTDVVTGATSYQLVLRTDEGQRALVWSEARTANSESATNLAHQIEALVPNLEALKETEYEPR